MTDVVPPEREWQLGDRVVDANDNFYVRRAAHAVRSDDLPWISGCGDWETDECLVRPLTHLIPAPPPFDRQALANALTNANLDSFGAVVRVVVEHLGLDAL